MSAHVLPIRVYLVVFVALLVLTGATVSVAFVDLGTLNLFVALGIAGLKATMVVMYFMHVKYNERLIGLFVMGGVFWLTVMLFFLLTDYWSRGWQPVPGW
jgi:cytochrome c oxidase subunit 4